MKKEKILQTIEYWLDKERFNEQRNSMGVSESYYNPHYLVGKCFTKDELLNMSDSEINNLIKLADYASEAFY